MKKKTSAVKHKPVRNYRSGRPNNECGCCGCACRNDEIMRHFDQLDVSGTGALPASQLILVVKQLTGFTDAQAGQFLASVPNWSVPGQHLKLVSSWLASTPTATVSSTARSLPTCGHSCSAKSRPICSACR